MICCCSMLSIITATMLNLNSLVSDLNKAENAFQAVARLFRPSSRSQDETRGLFADTIVSSILQRFKSSWQWFSGFGIHNSFVYSIIIYRWLTISTVAQWDHPRVRLLSRQSTTHEQGLVPTLHLSCMTRSMDAGIVSHCMSPSPNNSLLNMSEHTLIVANSK